MGCDSSDETASIVPTPSVDRAPPAAKNADCTSCSSMRVISAVKTESIRRHFDTVLEDLLMRIGQFSSSSEQEERELTLTTDMVLRDDLSSCCFNTIPTTAAKNGDDYNPPSKIKSCERPSILKKGSRFGNADTYDDSRTTATIPSSSFHSNSSIVSNEESSFTSPSSLSKQHRSCISPRTPRFDLEDIQVMEFERATAEDWPLLYYDEDELSEFRYESFVEECFKRDQEDSLFGLLVTSVEQDN